MRDSPGRGNPSSNLVQALLLILLVTVLIVVLESLHRLLDVLLHQALVGAASVAGNVMDAAAQKVMG